MKSRSEVLKSKKQSPEASKVSAAERTVPLPTSLPPDAIVDCKACGTKSKAGDCSVRADGFAECPSCAAPVTLEAPSKAEPGPGVSKLLEEKKTKEEKKQKAEDDKPRPPPTYCGDCGTELAWVAGGANAGMSTFFFSCGHTKDQHGMIDDPRKAKRPGTAPAPHGTRTDAEVARRDDEDRKAGVERPRAAAAASGPAFTATPLAGGGTRLSIPWGEARMPVDNFNNFKCGGHIITVEVPPGGDVLAAAKKSIDELERIADLMFDRQKKWYEKKLGILLGDGK